MRIRNLIFVNPTILPALTVTVTVWWNVSRKVHYLHSLLYLSLSLSLSLNTIATDILFFRCNISDQFSRK